MKKILVLAAVATAALVFSSVAFANSVKCAHGPSAGRAAWNPRDSTGSGTLPFTGLDLAGVAAVGGLLLVTGLTLAAGESPPPLGIQLGSGSAGHRRIRVGGQQTVQPGRLLCVYQHAPTPDAPGIYRHRRYFAELVRRGWQVDLVSTPRNYMTGEVPSGIQEVRLPQRDDRGRSTHHWVWTPGGIHRSRERPRCELRRVCRGCCGASSQLAPSRRGARVFSPTAGGGPRTLARAPVRLPLAARGSRHLAGIGGVGGLAAVGGEAYPAAGPLRRIPSHAARRR